MSRRKKLNILIPIIFILFFGAFARHRYIAGQITIAGHLQAKEMDETSGIAASGVFANIYYVHNDSGDTSRVLAQKPDGQLKNTK
jgi:hypothetical protein